MKRTEFHGHTIDMAELTDGWKIVKSEAEYRLWKLTRAPLDEVKAFINQCYKDYSNERKAADRMVEILNTQYCPECGHGYDRSLSKCPHCEMVAFEKMRKAQKKEQQAEDFNRFMDTTCEVIEIGNSFFRCIGKLLSIVFFPVVIIAMFLGACIDAQNSNDRFRSSRSRRRRRF